MIELIEYISYHNNTNKTIQFTSHQYKLGKSQYILQYLFSRHLIHFVVVYDIHLVTLFGSVFRYEYGKMKSAMFQKIMNAAPILF